MPQPSPSDVHVNAMLNNISVAYIQSQTNTTAYAATTIFPVVPTQKQSNRYFVYDRGDWFRVIAEERAPGAESVGGGWKIDNTPTYFARVYAVHKDVDAQTRANADDPIDMDRDATEWVTQQLLMRREQKWSADYFKSGVWTTDLTGVPGVPAGGQFKQWDQSGSTPIEDVTGNQVVIAGLTGYRPNVLVLGPWTFMRLKEHAEILDRIKYTQRGIITAEILAAVFEVERVVVAWAVVNSAREGQADSIGFVYGKSAFMAYAPSSPSILKPSAGYTFSWTGYTGASPEGTRMVTIPMPWIRSDRIEGEMSFDTKVVAPDLGVMFNSAVS